MPSDRGKIWYFEAYEINHTESFFLSLNYSWHFPDMHGSSCVVPNDTKSAKRTSAACNFKLHNLFHFMNLQEKQYAQIKRQQLQRFSKKIIKRNMKPQSRRLAEILFCGQKRALEN